MPFEAIISLAAKAAKISAPLLLAICLQESGLENKITENDGGSSSYGICQVKLDTARMLGYRGDADGLMDPQENARFAALYVKFQMERYENDLCKAVAAYNAGRYKESQKSPGYPKNLKYVIEVQEKLEKPLRDSLYCDRYRVYDSHGARCGIQSAKQAHNPDWSRSIQSAQRSTDRTLQYICQSR